MEEQRLFQLLGTLKFLRAVCITKDEFWETPHDVKSYKKTVILNDLFSLSRSLFLVARSCFQCVFWCWAHLAGPEEDLGQVCHCTVPKSNTELTGSARGNQQNGDLQAHSPNACRAVFGEGQLHRLLFLEYLFYVQITWGEENVLQKWVPLYSLFLSVKLYQWKSCRQKKQDNLWLIFEKSFTPFPECHLNL